MFLVGGTCIGGGMLALPLATGIAGFMPSILAMAICWLAMTTSALLLLEANLWMEEGAHVISMASRFLGPYGKAVSWLIYLFICYASIIAYTAGGGVQISLFFDAAFNWQISKDVGSFLFILLFGGVVDLGTRTIGRVNTILFIALIAAYVGLVIIGIPEIKTGFLLNRQWSSALMAVPLLLTTFSFQTMVPSLTPYLKRNGNALRWAIIGGTLITFVVYAIWQALILGIVPVEGPNGLAAVLNSGEPTSQFLKEHVQSAYVSVVAEYFAFFAIITSFIGIAFGLFDFLADGLKIEKKGLGKLALGLLIVIPTLIGSTQFERVFLLALDASGGFGDSILNGMIPVLMVWVGRYRLGLTGFRIPGGKIVLVAVFIFFSMTLFLEILAHLGYISSIYDGQHDIIQVYHPELIEAE
ncbi:MAG: amino acid transporter [Parachlamydiaceae bacterium]|nr:amino acid transporter [Parachlamydiaceae bacterium]